ncbi:MAG: phage integrase N-terminal SAM-like domain-containing protein [Lachnospiraceae bacterium]|nr:phage integrase N-terminal SAM-like domain-containing protein [Lachnospiraceae bacterium]
MYESYIEKIEVIGKLRNLKPGTIRTYKNNVIQFLEFIQKQPEELTCEDARDYLLFLKSKGDKASTLYNKNGSLVFVQDCFFVYTAIDCSLKKLFLFEIKYAVYISLIQLIMCPSFLH